MPNTWAGLQVVFPDHIPTHCRGQQFYFDDRRPLRRLDYTAEVIGGLPHAAHLCDDYQEFNGIHFPTKRKVLPLFFSRKPLPGPTLVAIEIHNVRT